MARGYLWANLQEEIANEFAQENPLVRAYNAIPYWEKFAWHIEGALGDMSGVRKAPKGRRRENREQWQKLSLREHRARQKAAGLCIDCHRERHPKSKNYCVIHRETSRRAAARKREAKNKLTK